MKILCDDSIPSLFFVMTLHDDEKIDLIEDLLMSNGDLHPKSKEIVDTIHPMTRNKAALDLLLGLQSTCDASLANFGLGSEMKIALVELYCPFMTNRSNYISLYLAVAFNHLNYDRLSTADRTAAMKFLKKEYNLEMFLDPLIKQLKSLSPQERLEILRHYLGDVTFDDAEVEEVLSNME